MKAKTLLEVKKGQYAVLSEIREGFPANTKHRVAEDIEKKMKMLLHDIEAIPQLEIKEKRSKAPVVFFACFEGENRAAWFKTERFQTDKSAGELLDWVALRMEEIQEPVIVTNMKIIR